MVDDKQKHQTIFPDAKENYIYETHNSPFDASMDIVDDSEIDTPTSTTSNTDPFAQSHPEGFNGSYE